MLRPERNKITQCGIHASCVNSVGERKIQKNSELLLKSSPSLSVFVSFRQSSPVFVSLRQSSSVFVSLRQSSSVFVIFRQSSSVFVSLRRYSSVFVSLRQSSSAFLKLLELVSSSFIAGSFSCPCDTGFHNFVNMTGCEDINE